MTAPQDIKEIVDASGGKLIGKTRLQKSAYFLEVYGVGYGFEFSYHYYGPYSEELTLAAEDAEALEMVRVEEKYTQSGHAYAEFLSDGPSAANEQFRRREEILALLSRYDTVSLELAATADFLMRNGFENDPWRETRRRKAAKISEERVESASELLQRLSELQSA